MGSVRAYQHVLCWIIYATGYISGNVAIALGFTKPWIEDALVSAINVDRYFADVKSLWLMPLNAHVHVCLGQGRQRQNSQEK